MNRQDAKDAKKRKREEKNQNRIALVFLFGL
jgi:hypothetical protein